MLNSMSLWKLAQARRREAVGGMTESVARAQTIGALGDTLIGDLIEETSRRIDEDPPQSLAALRARPDSLVSFSPEIELGKSELKSFLSQNFYHHPRVLRRTRKAEWVVGDLFRTYRDDPNLLPRHVHTRFAREGQMRAISDYIAGMTDRFAMDEHKRLLDPFAPT
jgi:dGTPase